MSEQDGFENAARQYWVKLVLRLQDGGLAAVKEALRGIDRELLEDIVLIHAMDIAVQSVPATPKSPE